MHCCRREEGAVTPRRVARASCLRSVCTISTKSGSGIREWKSRSPAVKRLAHLADLPSTRRRSGIARAAVTGGRSAFMPAAAARACAVDSSRDSSSRKLLRGYAGTGAIQRTPISSLASSARLHCLCPLVPPILVGKPVLVARASLPTCRRHGRHRRAAEGATCARSSAAASPLVAG